MHKKYKQNKKCREIVCGALQIQFAYEIRLEMFIFQFDNCIMRVSSS